MVLLLILTRTCQRRRQQQQQRHHRRLDYSSSCFHLPDCLLMTTVNSFVSTPFHTVVSGIKATSTPSLLFLLLFLLPPSHHWEAYFARHLNSLHNSSMFLIHTQSIYHFVSEIGGGRRRADGVYMASLC